MCNMTNVSNLKKNLHVVSHVYVMSGITMSEQPSNGNWKSKSLMLCYRKQKEAFIRAGPLAALCWLQPLNETDVGNIFL